MQLSLYASSVVERAPCSTARSSLWVLQYCPLFCCVIIQDSWPLGDSSCIESFVFAMWQQHYRRMFKISDSFQLWQVILSVYRLRLTLNVWRHQHVSHTSSSSSRSPWWPVMMMMMMMMMRLRQTTRMQQFGTESQHATLFLQTYLLYVALGPGDVRTCTHSLNVRRYTQGRRSIWDRGDTSRQYLDWGTLSRMSPSIFLE